MTTFADVSFRTKVIKSLLLFIDITTYVIPLQVFLDIEEYKLKSGNKNGKLLIWEGKVSQRQEKCNIIIIIIIIIIMLGK